MNATKKTTARRTRKPAADGSLNLATGELKVSAAKKTAAKRTTKKVAEPKPTAPKDFDSIDWAGRLEDKDPSELHEVFAKLIGQRADVEITAKQVQAVLTMHPYFQKSKHNKARSSYRPLAEPIVEQRSVHMKQAHVDARLIMDGLQAEAAAKKTTAKRATAKKAAPAKRTARKTTAKAKPSETF